MSGRPSIYLDFQATTPVDPRALDAMIPFFSKRHGNPHASDNVYGRAAAAAVAEARRQVAALIGANPRELLFTSGATESNNLLLRGALAMTAKRGRPRLVTCATEHKAVLEVARTLEHAGHPVTVLPVPPSGILDLAEVEQALGDDVGLVSVMAINNEIGVEQPIAAIGALCRRSGILFHTDAAQAAGKIAIEVDSMGIDLLSISAHKLYGPQGIGAAFIREAVRRGFPALTVGGDQERGLRPGTVPTALCVGFGAAAALALEAMPLERERLLSLRNQFLERLEGASLAFAVNGDLERRWPGNLNLSFEGVDAEALLMTTGDAIAFSSGSACTSEALEPSHVILALHSDPLRAETAVRIGFGRSTTGQEVDRAAAIVIDAVRRLQSVSRTATRGG